MKHEWNSMTFLTYNWKKVEYIVLASVNSIITTNGRPCADGISPLRSGSCSHGSVTFDQIWTVGSRRSTCDCNGCEQWCIVQVASEKIQTASPSSFSS